MLVNTSLNSEQTIEAVKSEFNSSISHTTSNGNKRTHYLLQLDSDILCAQKQNTKLMKLLN